MALEQAHAAVTETEREMRYATERLANAAHRAVDALSEYGTRAEERLRETGGHATERTGEIIDQVKHYIEDHPLAAIGIAAAVGFTLGMMLRGSEPAEHAEQYTHGEAA